MSAAVEAAARQQFLTSMRVRIFEPLGMGPHGRLRGEADPASGNVQFPEVCSGSRLARFGIVINSGQLQQRSTAGWLLKRVTAVDGTSKPPRWRANKRARLANTETLWAGWWRLC